MAEQGETHSFQAEVSALLNLVTNSLYTNNEIFLRELISNASDALDKARYEALVDENLTGKDTNPEILITIDAAQKQLIIEDNGIGLTKEEAAKNLGTIAHSGTLSFLEAAKKSGKDGPQNLIGQFGVGFYSAFTVAERVVVNSLSARAGAEPIRWTSSGTGEFTLAPSDRQTRGTQIILALKEDASEFLERYRIQSLIKRYSNYIVHPIKLKVIEPEAAKDGDEANAEDKEPEQINAASAIWATSSKELKDEDYEEFYKHVMGGFVLPGDEALARMHLTMDAPIQFYALLFVPGRAPADLFMEDRKALQLFAKRVMVDESNDKLLPQYLRFFRGVVDSEDLPLNVSREMLQDHSSLAAIRRQLTRKALKLLTDTASSEAEKYSKIWQEFGPVLKEGLHLDSGHRKELLELVRYRSTNKDTELVALKDYIAAMPESQEFIYYIAGENEASLRASPHLEGVRAKSYDVLLMTDAVDEWVLQSVQEYEGKKFRSVTQGDIEAAKDEDDAESKADKADEPSAIDPLLSKAGEILDGRVSKVRASKRLTNSAACLVDEEGGLSQNMQRILRMSRRGEDGPALPQQSRVLELNPEHEFVRRANELAQAKPDDERLNTWVEILHDLAGLSEGVVADPAGVVQRVQSVLAELPKD